LTRFVILRLLGCVYAVAFFTTAKQILPLIGSHVLLPVKSFLVPERFGFCVFRFCPIAIALLVRSFGRRFATGSVGRLRTLVRGRCRLA